MPKLQPPPGTVTRQIAVRVLMREKVITSAGMLAKLKGLNRVVLQGRSHGFYPEDRLLEIMNDHRVARGLPPLKSLFEGEHDIKFRQATSEDMPGVYEVAHKLFGHTTPAETRISILARCPEGNYVVTDHEKVVSYAHIYPLLTEPLQGFLRGDFRGDSITAEHLDPFAPGKVVDLLIKSLGSYHESVSVRKRYSKALFVGLWHELIRWGHEGYIVHRIYATSETPSGIESAVEFQMKSLGRIPTQSRKKRYGFELDPFTSEHRIMRDYRLALEDWKRQHPAEYEHAWQEWSKKHFTEK